MHEHDDAVVGTLGGRRQPLGPRPPAGASREVHLEPSEAQRIRLFRDVDLQAVWHLLETCPVRHLSPGQTLISAGDIHRDVHILIDGRLGIRLGTSEEIVASVEPGNSVGELAVIDQKPRSATVIASEPSRTLEVPEDVFWALLRRSHALALNMLGTVCERLRGSNLTLSESKRLQDLYERQASLDALTGIGNRRWLDDVLGRQMRRNAWKKEALSVLMLDIDHFKRTNDDHGHAAGDFVLFAVAQVLKGRLRPTDLCARYGGEEFTVVLPATPLDGALCAAERVRRAVAETDLVTPEGKVLPHVTVSLGAAEMGHEESPEELLARADAALYRAKHEGRDCVCAAERASGN
jgi:diguanylate cyclase (GGDEF)-like protein